MILWHVFLAFFIANLLGYGGGPASIPLMQEEIVNNYGWLSTSEFADILAVGNALPGPIATKIAAFVGYQNNGVIGVIIALLATVGPSALALIIFLQVLNKYRQSTVVKGMTILIQPVIAVMMILLTWDIGMEAITSNGYLQFFIIMIIALVAIKKLKVHPAILILLAFVYGGAIFPNFM